MAMTMILGRGMKELAETPRTYGVFGVRWFLRDNVWVIQPFLATILLAIVWVLLYLLLRRRSRLLYGLVALSFLIVSADLSVHYFGRRQQRQYRRSLPARVHMAITKSIRIRGRQPELLGEIAQALHIDVAIT